MAAGAQGVLDTPRQIADARKLLDSFRGHPVHCDVVPIEPRFNFTLRLQAGYVGRVSPKLQEGRQWVVLVRVKPRGDGTPVYLSDVVRLPAGGISGWAGDFSGSFWLGEGRYAVKWLMFDGDGDVCRKEWSIEARLKSQERRIHPLLPPNTVAGVAWGGVQAAGSTPHAGRLTILLHAASLRQGKSVLGTPAEGLLLDALLALMEEMPAGRVRLVVFNLDQQKELWRREGFTLQAMPEVAKALEETPVAVDYRVLQNPGGVLDLIEGLANREMHAAEPSEAVVFLGPHSLYNGKPSAGFARPAGAKQRFFYLSWANTEARRGFVAGGPASGGPMPNGGGMGAQERMAMGLPPFSPEGVPAGTIPRVRPASVRPNHGPDSIEYTVDQLGGIAFKVDSPDSFAGAVAEIRRTLGTNP
ncbi:MAG TPA: hypothetical protein VME43_30780 [Bryobacteraceae bacterium]|nr:hypothetical protein [Bryobacteraceae bacterium]